MSDLPPGYNSKYFSAIHPSENFISKVEASSSKYSSRISFNVTASLKLAVRQCLNEIGKRFNENDFGKFGTCFTIFGFKKIKKSLDGLCVKHLIDDHFYQTLVEQFPKAYGGTLNLASITAKSIPISEVLYITKNQALRISNLLKEIMIRKEKYKKEKEEFNDLLERARMQVEKLAFLNLRSQILGLDESIEARLVRSAFQAVITAKAYSHKRELVVKCNIHQNRGAAKEEFM